MYISINDCFELDKIVKSFEVAYRSQIVDNIKSKYPDLNSFSVAINKIDSSFSRSPILLINKYKTKIQKIKQEIADNYRKIDECYSSYLNKTFNNNVLYVSEILDYVILFFDELFTGLAKGFNSIEDYNSLNVKYNKVRNWLSHPASAQITVEDSKIILNFIKKVSANIKSNYFWYVSNKDIYVWADDLLSHIENTSLKYHNLSDVSFSHHRLLEREDELNALKSFIYGKDVGYRKSGSVVIYGYGGVGKTALVLEFLYRVVKDINDKTSSETFDFLLFFTAKEELLSYSETTKRLYIKDIRKQITSFNDFEEKFAELLQVSNLKSNSNLKGIIVIDNFETLSDYDKTTFLDFIKSNPRSIQFIITSRNEELCEDKLNLKEFNDEEKGLGFINDYIKVFELKLNLNHSEKLRLLNLAKGNALIIVLSLHLLVQNYSITSIFNDLENIEASNIEVISDFMYKNTIAHAIEDLKLKGYEPELILKVISLYDVPVDLYSLSKISNVNVNATEIICEYLTSKLILEKRGETYITNDFANKFIISKFIPNRIELKRLKEKIREHQKELDTKLKSLDIARKKRPLLDGILEDWKPKNSIDKIAISEAYLLFGKVEEAVANSNGHDLNSVEQEFERLEKMTSHPYIRFQKARSFQYVLKKTKDIHEAEVIKNKISSFFEEAIDITDFYYPFIKNTKSYASINWIYGLFLASAMKDISKSLRYLEDGVLIFQKLKIRDKAYFTAVNNLTWVYYELYKETKDEIYLNELKPLVSEVARNKAYLLKIKFKYYLYMKNFGAFNQAKPTSTKQNKFNSRHGASTLRKPKI